MIAATGLMDQTCLATREIAVTGDEIVYRWQWSANWFSLATGQTEQWWNKWRHSIWSCIETLNCWQRTISANRGGSFIAEWPTTNLINSRWNLSEGDVIVVRVRIRWTVTKQGRVLRSSSRTTTRATKRTWEACVTWTEIIDPLLET